MTASFFVRISFRAFFLNINMSTPKTTITTTTTKSESLLEMNQFNFIREYMEMYKVGRGQ